MNPRHLLAALAAAPLICAAEPPAVTHETTAQAAVPRISQDRLARIRSSLTSQIAVYEPAERAMRAPTTAEAAALANTASGSSTAVRLPAGGWALQGDLSRASFAVVRRDEDGKLVIGHDVVRKGDAHGR